MDNSQSNEDSYVFVLNDKSRFIEIKNNWKKLPFFFYFYSVVAIFFMILDCMVNVRGAFAHHPQNFIFKLFLWQPLTCLYINDGFISMLVSQFCILMLTLKLDHAQGSAYTIIRLNTQNVFIQ